MDDSEPELVEAEVVDYTKGGSSAPRLAPEPPGWRQNPRHDHATKVKLNEDPDAADQASWGNLAGVSRGGGFVDFSRAADPEPSVDELGRSVPRSRGLCSPACDSQITDYAAAGMAYRPSAAAGHRAMHAQQQGGRFGANVPEPAQIKAGHLESGNVLLQQEQIAGRAEVQQRQAMSEHYRHLLPGLR